MSPLKHWWQPGGGGALNFFSGRGVRPGFPKCGACKLTFASEKGGLWAENFQICGLVSWKFPNLGACELKFGWKLRLLRLKFPNFLKRGSCELTLLLEIGPLRVAGEAWKGGLQGHTSPYPLSMSVPPPRWQHIASGGGGRFYNSPKWSLMWENFVFWLTPKNNVVIKSGIPYQHNPISKIHVHKAHLLQLISLNFFKMFYFNGTFQFPPNDWYWSWLGSPCCPPPLVHSTALKALMNALQASVHIHLTIMY